MIKTFEDYVPLARDDALPWVLAKLQESVTPTDTDAIQIDQFVLDPVDADPSNPIPRNFTTTMASAVSGLYYRIIFVDANGDNSQPTEWVRDFQETPQMYRPSLQQVAHWLRSRLKDANGNRFSNFGPSTNPNTSEALRAIDSALGEVSTKIGDDIPADLYSEASDVVALRAAMQLELTYFPDQVALGRSPYEQYETMYQGRDGKSGRIATLVTAVNTAQAQLKVGTSGSGRIIADFPDDSGWMSRRM